jgi:ankyrin repeat protein
MEIRDAVTAGNLARLQKLLDNGVGLDNKDEDERTPLHWAAGSGALEVVEFLVEKASARLNVQDDAGWTPLMSAASAGHSEIVSFLLSQYVEHCVLSVARPHGSDFHT